MPASGCRYACSCHDVVNVPLSTTSASANARSASPLRTFWCSSTLRPAQRVHQRRVRFERAQRVAGERQIGVVDRDDRCAARAAVSRIVRDHQRDAVARVAHALAAQHFLVGVDEAVAVVRHVGRGQHRDDAGYRERARRVDAVDRRVRARARTRPCSAASRRARGRPDSAPRRSPCRARRGARPAYRSGSREHRAGMRLARCSSCAADFHRVEDLAVTGAAADVSADRRLVVAERRRTALFQQLRARHQHAGDAEPALDRTAVDERLLQRVKRIALRKPFDRGDLARRAPATPARGTTSRRRRRATPCTRRTRLRRSLPSRRSARRSRAAR